MSKVIVIGAGLAGSLLTIYLARRGFSIDVFEARPDMRKTEIAGGRSINLALSDRGIAGLREVGMDEYMLAEAVPMYGRMIHSVSGETKLLPYSGRKGEYINSVSRAGLNIALMNEAEKYPNVQFIFNQRCVGFNIEVGEVLFENERTIRGDTVIATDGAGSAVRRSMQQSVPGFEITEEFLEYGYKELHIPPQREFTYKPDFITPSGTWYWLEPNALHIWPRRKFMMIALPNIDGSFTCTLFLAHKSAQRDEPSFEQLCNADSVMEFFNRQFPGAVPYMPTLLEDFFQNPTGSLGTVQCWPWNIDRNALLLGDSAHAMVPFYGQGMNCAFEDVRILDGLIETHGDVWSTVFDEYGQIRKENTDAIQDMAQENFYEMRDATADPIFQRKRELETRLEQTYPDYFSKYSMVTFREDLPYVIASERGNAQDRILMEICEHNTDIDRLDLDEVMHKVRSLT
jgi:kynurenine 3-monooxygenase